MPVRCILYPAVMRLLLSHGLGMSTGLSEWIRVRHLSVDLGLSRLRMVVYWHRRPRVLGWVRHLLLLLLAMGVREVKNWRWH